MVTNQTDGAYALVYRS